MRRVERASAASVPAKMRGAALREYYAARELLFAKEALLKLLSVLVCVASAAVSLSGAGAGSAWGACSTAPGLVALGSAAAMALLYAGALLSAPLLAPFLWFYTELLVSALVGALLLVTALLGAALCARAPLRYLHAALSLVGAGAVTVSGALVYAAVTRRWGVGAEGARRHHHPPAPSRTSSPTARAPASAPATEHDV